MFKFITSLPPRTRAILGISVIALAVILTLLYAPRYDDSTDNVTGDPEGTPTITVTNQLSSADLQRSVDLPDTHIFIKRVTLATEFSDDPNNRKRNSPYTLRLLLTIRNTTTTTLNFRLPDITRLLLPDGQQIHSRLVSISPAILPKQTVSGYADFPLTNPVPLSDLKLQFNTGEIIPLTP